MRARRLLRLSYHCVLMLQFFFGMCMSVKVHGASGKALLNTSNCRVPGAVSLRALDGVR